jgi:hypothetical protein
MFLHCKPVNLLITRRSFMTVSLQPSPLPGGNSF